MALALDVESDLAENHLGTGLYIIVTNRCAAAIQRTAGFKPDQHGNGWFDQDP
jgi:hypothetical protein